MAPLKNNRHEKFCLEVVAGRNYQQAAINAGYSIKSARMFPYILRSRADIQARIQELQEAIASEKVMDVIKRKEKLSEIAQARITDFMTTEGSPHITVNKETPGAAAIQSLQIREGKQGASSARVTDIKLHDPVRAIAELNKLEGSYPPEKHQITGANGPVEILVKYADPICKTETPSS